MSLHIIKNRTNDGQAVSFIPPSQKDALMSAVRAKQSAMLNNAERPDANIRWAGTIKSEIFEEWDVHYLNLDTVSFVDCSFRNCNFKSTLFNECSFKNCEFVNCDFSKSIHLECNHKASGFLSCDMHWSHFSCNMSTSAFSKCDLTDTNFASLGGPITTHFVDCEGMIDMGSDLKGTRYIAIRRRDGSGGGYNVHWDEYIFARCQIIAITEKYNPTFPLPPHDPKVDNLISHDHRCADLLMRIEMTDTLATSRGWKIVTDEEDDDRSWGRIVKC